MKYEMRSRIRKYRKKTSISRKRRLGIVCLILLCLGNPVVSSAGTEHVEYGALRFRVYRESGSSASCLVVDGYEAEKDSTGNVSIEPRYTDSGETRKVGGIDAEVFMGKTLSSLYIKSDIGIEKYTIGARAFTDAQIGISQSPEIEDKCVIQGGKTTIIGARAFSGAQIGGNVKIKVSDALICKSAFQDAKISGVLQITGTIDTLQEYVFSGLRVKALHLSTSVLNIESRAFADSNIMEYKLETTVKTLGSQVFEGCEHLKKIILPENNCSMEVAEDAFPDREGITIVIPEGLTNLSTFHLENYPHAVFQTAEHLTEESPVIRYLKENCLTYKRGENGSVNVPDKTPVTTETPTETPTEAPTEPPTEPPIEAPTETPTEPPTQIPTELSTRTPTEAPTQIPTGLPVQTPTGEPTKTPLLPGTKKTAGKKKKIYTSKKIKYRIKDKHKVTVAGAASDRLQKLKIPDMVTIEGKLYKVVQIEKRAFWKQKKVKTVLVGNYVKEIGNEAFAKCTGLTKIQFGTGVKTLGKRVLYQDRKLKKIIFKGKRLRAIGRKTFSGVPRKVDIRADKKMVKKYAGLIKQSNK